MLRYPAYISDIKEANEIFHIQPWPPPFSDINTLVHKRQLLSPTFNPAPREELAIKQVDNSCLLLYLIELVPKKRIIMMPQDIRHAICERIKYTASSIHQSDKFGICRSYRKQEN